MMKLLTNIKHLTLAMMATVYLSAAQDATDIQVDQVLEGNEYNYVCG